MDIGLPLKFTKFYLDRRIIQPRNQGKDTLDAE
jgi:hypothetical protein